MKHGGGFDTLPVPAGGVMAAAEPLRRKPSKTSRLAGMKVPDTLLVPASILAQPDSHSPRRLA